MRAAPMMELPIVASLESLHLARAALAGALRHVMHTTRNYKQ